jgi:hypothetical protein
VFEGVPPEGCRQVAPLPRIAVEYFEYLAGGGMGRQAGEYGWVSLKEGCQRWLDGLYFEYVKYYSLREDQKIIFVHVNCGEFCLSFVCVLFVCGVCSPQRRILWPPLLPKEYRNNDMETSVKSAIRVGVSIAVAGGCPVVSACMIVKQTVPVLRTLKRPQY